VTDPAAARQSQGVSSPRQAPDEPEGGGAVDFDGVYRAHFSYVWHTVRRLGGPAADLEDLAHDVFVVVHRRLPDYDPARPLRPWLFGIAYRVVSEHRRRSGRAPQRADGIDPARAPAGGDGAAALEARRLLARGLEALDLDERAVLVMHDVDGHTAPDIAAALEAPVNTVYSRLRRARRKLAAAVGGAVGGRGGR
jgi:RNA polymerase sigma-70 factor, ECF subfamily